ncbi:MAG: type I-MYXAN CRISPR-associated Cas8a1/Cmx1, partial [Actinobacteria bacterium]|nr:type I-MYXAN CRISPR-associated Cas8a1/Cmx1 [Actinomycetota bacterium]
MQRPPFRCCLTQTLVRAWLLAAVSTGPRSCDVRSRCRLEPWRAKSGTGVGLAWRLSRHRSASSTRHCVVQGGLREEERIQMPEMTVALSDPGMGILHRAGLAGLWMTLDAADAELKQGVPGDDAAALRDAGTWTLGPNRVSLSWDGDGKGFFRALFDYAYPVDAGIGLLHFRAFGDPMASPADAFATHRAMLMTFLQHPQSRKAETGNETSSIRIDGDGETDVLSLRRTTSHAFRTAPYSPLKSDAVAGWLVPGGAERHVGHGGTSRLSETPTGMLALRFAPIGCLFSL